MAFLPLGEVKRLTSGGWKEENKYPEMKTSAGTCPRSEVSVRGEGMEGAREVEDEEEEE